MPKGATMSNVEQFERVVTEAGAVAMRIMRGPRGAERLVIQTPGGLITREVPLMRRSRQRHSARHDIGSGDRRERQTPYSRTGHKLELVAAAEKVAEPAGRMSKCRPSQPRH